MSRQLLLIAAASLAFGGCVGETSSRGLVLSLTGDAEGLRLSGTPRDPGYAAEYPNPEEVDELIATLRPDGSFAIDCFRSGSPAECSESPFRTEVLGPALEGLRVRVWDIYGEVLAEAVAAGGGDLPLPAGGAASGETPDRAPFLEGPRRPEGDEEEPRERRERPERPEHPRGFEGEVPPVPSLDDCDKDELSRQMCEAVNVELGLRGSPTRLDCTQAYTDFSLPPVRFREETEFRRCGEVLDPVEDDFDDSGNVCQEIALHQIAQALRNELISKGVCLSSPLIVDLGGDGVTLSDPDQGAVFDLFASGDPVATAWPSANDAFVAVDLDGDGVVSDGSELLGEHSFGDRFGDGFEALATFDSNRDGQVDAADERFDTLVLWADADRDGVSEASEVAPLASFGISRLSLRAEELSGSAARDAFGNSIPLRSHFETEAGEAGELVDAFLRFQPVACEPAPLLSRP